MNKNPFFFGLLKRQEMILPSFKGAVLALILLVTIAYGFLKTIHPFLAVSEPLPRDQNAEILVVEGWVPDYCLKEAIQIFRKHPYRFLVTTGGPLPEGTGFSNLGSHAQFAANSLQRMGLSGDSIVVVPSEWAKKDRTYLEGVALKTWLQKKGNTFSKIDLFSFSAHSRRSRYLYHKALGKDVSLGVYAPRDLGYDAAEWWKSSNGVRQITDETIAYLYAVLVFKE